MNALLQTLQKVTKALETEDISYMIVGGFAMSYYNLARFTADIDIVVQIYPNHVDQILLHFPEWMSHSEYFKQSVSQGQMFNLIDFETGVRIDFMAYKDSDYNWVAFGRRQKVDFLGVSCMISSPEDLVISKLMWYNLSKSDKQKEDILFLLREAELDRPYLEGWADKLFLKRHGFF